MPLYDFKCGACGAHTEKLQSYTDAAPKCADCPGSPAMKRQVSRTSFKLQGYSWGKNGYENRPPTDVGRVTKD